MNPRLQRLIWGVDFYAFEERFVGFRHPETRARLEGDGRHMMALQIAETLLGMRALRDSSRVLVRAARGEKRRTLTIPVPWPQDLIRTTLETNDGRGLDRADAAWIKAELVNWVVSYEDYRLSDSQVSLYRRTVGDLRRAGLEVILFVPPLSRCELESIDQSGAWVTFQDWKRALLAAGPYWDFS